MHALEQNSPKKKRRFRLHKKHIYKGLQILPNLFTLGNAFFGFCSVIFATYSEFEAAAYFILVGALFDALDGRVARLAKATSKLGMELDSLSDAVTFCLAPAVLVYLWQLNIAGALGLFTAASFLLAGLLRLARFNVTHSQQTYFFMGMPTPIAGCFLASLAANMQNTILLPLHIWMLVGLVLLLSLLMISTIPFPSFKHLSKNTYATALVISAAIAIVMGLLHFLLFLFVVYFIFALEETLRKKIKTHFLGKNS